MNARCLHVVLAAGVVLCAAPASQRQLHFHYALSVESTAFHWYKCVHYSPINLDIEHDLGHSGDWLRVCTATERDRGNDLLVVTGSLRHIVAPHGEEPNPRGFNFNYDINADNWPTGANSTGPDIDSIDHPPTNHPDSFESSLSFTTTTNILGNDQIESWTFVLDGSHKHRGCRGKGCGMDSRQPVQPTGSNAHGCAVMCLDTTKSQFNLNVAVAGIRPQDLIGASIRHARPGFDGPIIYSLGDGSAWEDADGQGTGVSLVDQPFPPQFVDAYERGELYLELSTNQFPQGEIRGQLTDASTSIPPQALHVIRGLVAGGGLAEILEGDDRYLVLRSLRSQGGLPSAHVQVEATSPTQDPLSLELWVQSHVNAQSHTLTTRLVIEMLNFRTGDWDVVEAREPTSGDSVARVRLDRQAADYIEPGTGRMECRIGWLDLGVPFLAWGARIDQVQWVIVEQ